jgi:hypothetical protein
LPDGKLTKKGRSLSDYVFWLLLFVLALKALGLTKVWFNIDPYGFNVSFDIGSAISLVLFGLVWQKQDTLTTTLSKQGERLANLEGRLQPTKSQ